MPHAAGGPTACADLCRLCRSHHRLRTFTQGWTFVLDPDGTLHVTTPTGITRITHPPGMRRRPPRPQPPPDEPDDDPPPF